MLKKINKQELNTKEKILHAAFTLFAQRGMKDISMREIAQACGVTKPVIYYYFKDKDALCAEIVNNFERRQDAKLLALAASAPNFPKFLESLFASYMNDEANQKIVPFMMHLHSYASSNPQMNKALTCHHARSGDVLAGMLGAQVKKGAITHANQDLLKHLIFANIMHMVLNTHHNNLKFKPSYAADMAKAILKAADYKG